MLEEDDRVGIGDRREQQPLGVRGRRRREHLQAGRVHEPGLGILRVERPAGEAAAARQAHDDRGREPQTVVQLAGDVDELVEAAGDEVGELHLADRPHADDRGADGAADDRLLGDRRVDHAVDAELLPAGRP